jgi:prolipoprotein diacylglyceryltransferase
VLTFPGANYSTWLDIRGGFSLFGGLLLSAALSWAYLRYRQQDIWRMADLLVPGFIAALILVRVGCFLVGDHVGAVTEFPWGEGYADGTLRHPVALYEILFLSLFLVIFRSSERRRPVGNFFLSFCTAYTAYLFIFDFFRCTDFSFCEARYFFLTGSQWLAAGIFLAFSVFWLVKRAKT